MRKVHVKDGEMIEIVFHTGKYSQVICCESMAEKFKINLCNADVEVSE